MSKSIQARLVELNAHLDRAVEFAQNPQKEENHTGRNLAIGAAGLGAAALGGTYLRGRSAIKKSGAPVLIGKNGKAVMPGFGTTLKAGLGALKGDASKATGYVGGKLSSAGSVATAAADKWKNKAQGKANLALGNH